MGWGDWKLEKHPRGQQIRNYKSLKRKERPLTFISPTSSPFSTPLANFNFDISRDLFQSLAPSCLNVYLLLLSATIRVTCIKGLIRPYTLKFPHQRRQRPPKLRFKSGLFSLCVSAIADLFLPPVDASEFELPLPFNHLRICL